ncbi:hypothetical protein ACFFRS_27370, partial [Saccharopolyspora hordei]
HTRARMTATSLCPARRKISQPSRHASAQPPIWKANRSEGASLYILDPDGHKLELHLGDLASRLAHFRQNAPKDMTVF